MPKHFAILGLILARGGSKRIPRKNLVDIGGKPLIAYTINAAKESGVLDRIVVSTDDEEIASTARSFGAETPFLRPAALSADTSSSEEAMFHALHWLETEERYKPEFVMLLQPTSPLRTAGDIRAAVHLAQERNADSVVSVFVHQPHPYTVEKGDGDTIEIRYQASAMPHYQLNGAIYLIRTEVLRQERTLYPRGKTYPYVMPFERSLDVDTPFDVRVADSLLRVSTD